MNIGSLSQIVLNSAGAKSKNTNKIVLEKPRNSIRLSLPTVLMLVVLMGGLGERVSSTEHVGPSVPPTTPSVAGSAPSQHGERKGTGKPAEVAPPSAEHSASDEQWLCGCRRRSPLARPHSRQGRTQPERRSPHHEVRRSASPRGHAAKDAGCVKEMSSRKEPAAE